MTDNYTICYTLCNKGNMPVQIEKSLLSTSQFFDKENIVVFFTPPQSKELKKKLEKYALVKLVPNITEPFKFRPGNKPSFYGEKIHICNIDTSTVIFLDCDTIMKKDIRPLLKGNYDISFRSGSEFKDFDMNIWKKLFSIHNKTTIPMPNLGFFIMKNNLHKMIKDNWLNFINKDLLHPHPTLFHKEQIALALSLPSNCKIRWMKKSEHAFGWSGEGWVDTYLLHTGGANRKFLEFGMNIKHTFLDYLHKLFLFSSNIK